jgi:hypothetical protein
MSWWVMITTTGRLLTNVHLAFLEGEIRLYEYRLKEGEDVAILLDTYHNKARIYRPFDECERLAALHQYELFIRRNPEETFVSHIERLLQLRHPIATEIPCGFREMIDSSESHESLAFILDLKPEQPDAADSVDLVNNRSLHRIRGASQFRKYG